MGYIKKYEKIVGKEVINELYSLTENLKDKKVLMINSTAKGGGVAEILKSLVPLMNGIGIKTKWLVLNADEKFFEATKTFHNALQGDINIDIKNKIKNYENFYKNKLEDLNPEIIDNLKKINSSDIVVIHDPQPLGLIKYKKENSKWIWRVHIDLSNSHKELWNFIEKLSDNFDKIIVSKKSFIKGDPKRYKIIHPSIDVFDEINKEISDEKIKEILAKNNIPTDKPIIAQVSRLDKWKDPIGVIKAYKLVKKEVDCRLILLYSDAKDDPEGKEMYKKVLKAVQESKEKDILLIGGDNFLLVNAVQRISSVILQKSLKEGFALTISEALWKKTPVIGTNVGGIPLQIKHGKNGYLVERYEINEKGEPLNEKTEKKHLKQTANLIKELLINKEKMEKMGIAGKEIVKNNFLMTRHIKDYLMLFKELSEKKLTFVSYIKKKFSMK
jgi:trehalose synthase